MAEQYVYAVTRIHYAEQSLLSEQEMEQLISAPSVEEVMRILDDKGWGAPDLPLEDPDTLVAVETEKTWGLVQELAGDVAPFNVFRYANDFHNLKAAIKLAYTANEEEDKEHYFQPFGTIELEKIIKAANEHDFSSLPEPMASAGREAYEVLAHTGNGQLCDMVLDRAALVAIYDAGTKSGSEVLTRYATLTVDAANIKAAVRCSLMGKSREFAEKAIAPTGTLDTGALLSAASSDSLDALYSYLSFTSYASAVPELQKSLAAFERWCDNQMMELIKPQRYNYFSIEPLAAFILGRENEIRMVRLILSAKINHLSEEVLRERLRITYV
ncbi:V-type ATPase subunit [Ruminococcaceae bacterium OttesenSCG-928-I18]|nr:V-type ATPase subunit [Ruminococcaceae bacterium OttesenSCG-928-I18]